MEDELDTQSENTHLLRDSVNKRVLRLRRHAAIGILVAYSLSHNISLVHTSRLKYLERAQPDSIAALDKRFTALRAVLLTYRYERVGFITDIPEDGRWVDEYFRAQYVLAPVVLDDSPTAAVVVADFKNTSCAEDIMRVAGFFPMAEYGKGVCLLSRNKR